jgi:hypothetical protein
LYFYAKPDNTLLCQARKFLFCEIKFIVYNGGDVVVKAGMPRISYRRENNYESGFREDE